MAAAVPGGAGRVLAVVAIAAVVQLLILLFLLPLIEVLFCRSFLAMLPDSRLDRQKLEP